MRLNWGDCLIVGLGSGLGGVLRYFCVFVCAPRFGEMWATTGVNIIGSFAIGLLASVVEQQQWRIFLMTGLLGGFTTFSAFSLQTVQALKAGLIAQAFGNMAISLACCVGAAALGAWLVRS